MEKLLCLQVRLVNHIIELQLGASLPNLPLYRMSLHEAKILQDQIEQLLRDGLIRPSLSTCAILALLVPKKNGNWRMCNDSRVITRLLLSTDFQSLGLMNY